MAADPASLLPPNARALERAIEGATARIGAIPTPIEAIWNPATIAIEQLPWLAWALSIDRWETDWAESQKRAAVADAIAAQRRKGTPASIDAVLGDFDDLLRLVEWFEASPPGAPHTFEVQLALAGAGGDNGGYRASATFAEAIVREVTRVKPARSHFQLVQMVAHAGNAAITAGGLSVGFVRLDTAAAIDTLPGWLMRLQTQDGEPMTDDSGDYLEE